MGSENKRRYFLKQLFALSAFSAGSLFSFNGKKVFDGDRAKSLELGFSKAGAKESMGKVKKIACEEHIAGEAGNLDQRLEEMDKAGIDMQVIGGGTAKNIKSYNDMLAEIVNNKHPGRFAAYCALPWDDPEAAPVEFERAVKDLGLKGPMIYAGRDAELYLDDKRYWGIYETAEKLDMPVYIHPGAIKEDMSGPYTSPYPIVGWAMWGFAASTGLHAVRLIVSGVFDKYPNLKIILGHMGEGIPYWLWRMDKHYIDDQAVTGKDVPGNDLKHLPSYYFKKNFSVTTSGMLWEPVLQFVITALGADRILFACDYPPEPDLVFATNFIESVSISESDREKICHRNAEKLLKI